MKEHTVFSNDEIDLFLHGCCHAFAAAAHKAYPECSIFGIFSYRKLDSGQFFPCLDHAFLYEPLSGKVFDALGVRGIKDVYDNYWTGDKHGGDGPECFLREMSPYELMGFEEVGSWMGFYDFQGTFQRSVNELTERILKEFGETIDLTH